MQKPAVAEQAADVPPSVPLETHVSLAPGPDGQLWVVLTFTVAGIASQSVRMPLDGAEIFGPALADEIAKAVAEGKRQGTGLAVATPADAAALAARSAQARAAGAAGRN